MNRILIIAEAGVNHNGSLDTAKALVMAAKECGADIVKFQTINVDELVSKHAAIADYQKNNLSTEESQKDMLKKLALKKEDFYTLANYCRETGIKFLSLIKTAILSIASFCEIISIVPSIYFRCIYLSIYTTHNYSTKISRKQHQIYSFSSIYKLIHMLIQTFCLLLGIIASSNFALLSITESTASSADWCVSSHNFSSNFKRSIKKSCRLE